MAQEASETEQTFILDTFVYDFHVLVAPSFGTTTVPKKALRDRAKKFDNGFTRPSKGPLDDP